MNAGITALIISIVGVVGTLLASIVTQRLSAVARREELKQQRLLRQDEYEREQREKVLANKRICYVAMISTTRRYRLELMSYLYAVKQGAVNDEAGTRLQDARLAFAMSLAETQLTGTIPVLEALEPIRKGMAQGYAETRELEQRSLPESASSFEEIRTFLLKLWDEWPTAYAAMRSDLRVED